MKKINNLFAGVLALAATAILPSSAHAASNSYSVGDLLIGFEKPGNAHDYVIDLGPASYFIGLSATPGVTTNLTTSLGLGNIAADLSSSGVFGSGWATNGSVGTNVQWGVVGATSNSVTTFGLPKNTLFFTSGELTPGTVGTPLTASSNGVQGTTNTKILQLENAYAGSDQTANSTKAQIQSTGDANNWSSFSPSFNAFATGYNIEQPSSGSFIGPTNSVLDLWELKPGNGTDGVLLGSFSLDSSGNLSFTTIPEPSTYVLLSLSSIGLVIFFRRRKTLAIA